MTQTPATRPSSPGPAGVVATALLLVAQLGLDAIGGLLAVFVASISTHQTAALLLLCALALGYVAALALSLRRPGGRSPVTASVLGLLASVVATLLCLGVLAALGTDP